MELMSALVIFSVLAYYLLSFALTFKSPEPARSKRNLRISFFLPIILLPWNLALRFSNLSIYSFRTNLLWVWAFYCPSSWSLFYLSLCIWIFFKINDLMCSYWVPFDKSLLDDDEAGPAESDWGPLSLDPRILRKYCTYFWICLSFSGPSFKLRNLVPLFCRLWLIRSCRPFVTKN